MSIDSKNNLFNELKSLKKRRTDLETDEKRHLNKIERLKEVNHLLTLIIDNLPVMAYICNADNNRTMEFVSSSCFDIIGYKPVDLISSTEFTFGNIIHPDDRLNVLEEINSAIEEHRPFDVEYRVKTADGDVKKVKDHGQAVYSEDDEFLIVQGYVAEVE